MSAIYYFGCGKDDTGHYLWAPDGAWISRHGDPHPWKDHIDGGLCPQKTRKFGVISYNVKDGWSGIGFWDSSKDHRHGSHSTFVVDMVHAPEDILALARELFPWVFERIKFEVVIPAPLAQHDKEANRG